MKTIKITCDRCGCEITGNPYRVFIEQVERDSEDILGETTMDIQNDFCETCAMGIAVSLTERPVSLIDVFETETETEPETEEPVSDLSETCQKPEPRKRGGSVKGVKRFTDERREIVSQMVQAGESDEVIARALDMPVEQINRYIAKTGFRNLISDKPKHEPKSERVTASGVTFGM